MSPKAKLPLGSAAATKSIGKMLTFYRRGSKQKVRLYHKPTGLPSAGQTAQRAVIGALVKIWQGLSNEDKASWNSRAKALGDPWSGYTLFMRSYIMKLLDLEDTPSTYTDKALRLALVKVTEDAIEFGPRLFLSDDAPVDEGDDGDLWFEY